MGGHGPVPPGPLPWIRLSTPLANSCTALCVYRRLLCQSSPVAQYQAVHSIDCVSKCGCRPRAVTVGLLQRYLSDLPLDLPVTRSCEPATFGRHLVSSLAAASRKQNVTIIVL